MLICASKRSKIQQYAYHCKCLNERFSNTMINSKVTSATNDIQYFHLNRTLTSLKGVCSVLAQNDQIKLQLMLVQKPADKPN